MSSAVTTSIGLIKYVLFELIDCHETWCYVYSSVQAVIVFSFGIVAPLILNIIMFHEAKKLRTTVACGTIASVEIVGPGDDETKEQNIRAMVTIALLLAAIVGLTSPYVIFVATKAVLGFDVAPGSPASVIAILAFDLYALVPTVDALVIWRNRDVKACVKPFCRRMWNTFKHCTDQCCRDISRLTIYRDENIISRLTIYRD